MDGKVVYNITNSMDINEKEVLISGQRVPVVNYFMDSIMVDITDRKSL